MKNTNEVKIGQRVLCNGYPGTISKVHGGQLEGMVDVRMSRGSICIDINDLGLRRFCNCMIPQILNGTCQACGVEVAA